MSEENNDNAEKNLLVGIEKTSTSENKTGNLDSDTDTDTEMRQAIFSEDNNYEVKVTKKMLEELTGDIAEELRSKSRTKLHLIFFTVVFFSIITYIIFKIVFDRGYSDDLKSILLGGFFANLIGLLVIIFKYVFSQSKELYDFWIDIRNGIYHKKDK